MTEKPKIDKRFQKAQVILELPDGVMQDIKKPDYYLVRSEKDPVMTYRVYFIVIYGENGKPEKKRGKCECVDYMWVSTHNIDHKCKHILAIHLGQSRKIPFKKIDIDQFLNE